MSGTVTLAQLPGELIHWACLPRGQPQAQARVPRAASPGADLLGGAALGGPPVTGQVPPPPPPPPRYDPLQLLAWEHWIRRRRQEEDHLHQEMMGQNPEVD